MMLVDILTEGSATGDGSVHAAPVENNFTREVSIIQAVINSAIRLSQLWNSQFLEQIMPGAKEIPVRIPGIIAFVNLYSIARILLSLPGNGKNPRLQFGFYTTM